MRYKYNCYPNKSEMEIDVQGIVGDRLPNEARVPNWISLAKDNALLSNIKSW